MATAIIDSCCLIDLLASGHAESILRACGHEWHLPDAVRGEVQFIRQRDPTDPSKVICVSADLSGLFAAGVLKPCSPEAQAELDSFVQYAVQFRSDGEAMCLALAESRGWLVATDDKKAIQIGQRVGLTVISSPQLLKTWAEREVPSDATLVTALKDIEHFAQFRPNQAMRECQWWLDQATS